MENRIEQIPEQSQGVCGSEDGSTGGVDCYLGGQNPLHSVIQLHTDGN